MNVGLFVFLIGLFAVPLALLVLGHRVRRRSPRARHVFIGALIGHCVAGVVAVVWGMIPPETWTPDEWLRGFAGLWSLLALPVAGGIIGALSPRTGGIALGALVVVALVGGGIAATQQRSGALVGVIGDWSVVMDGGTAWRVDGERWGGETTRDALARSMQPFFPALTDSMAANATSPGAFPLAIWSGAPDFTGGTIRVRFKMHGGKSDQNAGIVFNLRPNGEYHYVRYNTKDGDAAVWRFRNGERERIVHGTTHVQLALGEWHELTLRVDGTRVTAAANDSITVEHVLDAPVRGRVGVWVKRDAVTSFRDFRVQD